MSGRRRRLHWALPLALLAASIGCRKKSEPPPEPPGASATIGAAGGTVTAPDGAQVVIPPGALGSDTVIGIRQSDAGMPALPAGRAIAGPVYELTPHDVAFAVPVTVRFPTTANGDVTYLVSSPSLGWREIHATAAGGMAEARTESLSWWASVLLMGCTDPAPRPYGCAQFFLTDGTLASNPMGALVDLPQPAPARMTVPGTLQVSATYFAAGDCADGRVQMIRVRSVPPQLVVQVVRDEPVAFAPYPQDLKYGTGRYSAELPVTRADNGLWRYGLAVSCRRAGATVSSWSLFNSYDFTIEFDLPDPASRSTVGGTVSGLTGPGLVLQNNGGDDIALPADGAFVFPTSLANGSSYDVAVKTQPAGRVCVVGNGSGTATADVRSVQVDCGPPTFTVGGTVSGLGGAAGLVLQNNGADDLPVVLDGPFAFSQPVASGAAYSVTVKSHPAGRFCRVGNGTGTASAPITSVAVSCVTFSGAAPTVELDYNTGIDLPVAGVSYSGGAAVLDNGTLRLLGLANLRGGSTTSIAGVAGMQPLPIGIGGNQNLRVLLYATDGTGGSCGGGNELRAIAIHQSVEGATWVSPPALLHTAAEVVPGTPGCIFGASGAHTPRGFEFAVTESNGTLTVGRLQINVDTRTDTWSSPTVTKGSLPFNAACPNASLDAGTMAGVFDVAANPAASPPRIAVLAFRARTAQASATCAAVEDAAGSWSALAPAWDNGLDAGGAPVFSEPVVAMDTGGNAFLAGSRRVGTDDQLATAFLPAAGTQWQLESAFPAFGVVAPALELDPGGHATLLYRNKPTSADAFTTVYAARRAAGGSWSARQRLVATDGDTRFPRLGVADNGEVLALFSYAETPPFQVLAAPFVGGSWGAPQPVQPPGGSPEGRFAVGARHWGSSSGTLGGLRVYWRETDPANAARFRIVSAVPVP